MKSKVTVTKISKWGNGYGIRIPIATLQEYSLTEGSSVVVSKELGGVKISPKTPSLEDVSLTDLMKGVSPSQLRTDFAETAFGRKAGNEIW